MNKLHAHQCIGILVAFFMIMVHGNGSVQAETNAVLKQKLQAEDVTGNFFGFSVAQSRKYLVVGAHGDRNSGVNSGAAYVFKLQDGKWIEHSKLIPSDGRDHLWFGWSVAISGRTIVVGSYGRKGKASTGAAYVFRRIGNEWNEEAKLSRTDEAKLDHFGYSVAVYKDTLVVGTPGDDDQGKNSGSAYVYRRIDGIWMQEAKLLASSGGTKKQFGFSVAAGKDTIAIKEGGTLYIYEADQGFTVGRTLRSWMEKAQLKIDGTKIAMSGKTIVVGDFVGSGPLRTSGLARVVVPSGSGWIEKYQLTANNGKTGDRFGESVSIHKKTIVIGAPGVTDKGAFSGAAYMFKFENNQWIEKQKLVPKDLRGGAFFGHAVAVKGSSIAIGAQGIGGATYIYR